MGIDTRKLVINAQRLEIDAQKLGIDVQNLDIHAWKLDIHAQTLNDHSDCGDTEGWSLPTAATRSTQSCYILAISSKYFTNAAIPPLACCQS